MATGGTGGGADPPHICIQINDLDTYMRCRVKLHAQGIVLRDAVIGAEIKTKKQQVCKAGEFLVAEIDAKVGGFGIVPDELNGSIVSSHYFLFEIDEAKLDKRFLDFYSRTPAFRDQVAAQGSTNYAATQLDDVYIQLHHDHLLITSPGAFPEGVTIDNLLVHEPKPRNPRLATAFKRIGLVEQTGRGVDRIFEGQLRYGRPAPDYTRTDNNGVRVILNGGEPSLKFASFVYEEDKAGRPFVLDELIVLNTLFVQRRIDADQVAKAIQKGPSEGKRVLERLLECGLIEARGEKRARIYHLAASLYNRLDDISGYVRTKALI